jgi:hypothetical protein
MSGRSMLDAEIVEGFCRYYADQHAEGPAADHVAVEELGDLEDEDPERCWKILNLIVEATDNMWTLVMLGAGELEDLLNDNPTRYFPLLTEAIRRNPRWLIPAANVWGTPVEAELQALLEHYGQPRL